MFQGYLKGKVLLMFLTSYSRNLPLNTIHFLTVVLELCKPSVHRFNTS